MILEESGSGPGCAVWCCDRVGVVTRTKALAATACRSTSRWMDERVCKSAEANEVPADDGVADIEQACDAFRGEVAMCSCQKA